ncbi:MAG: hypothetical protein U5L07_03190 [Desulfobacterales bacterium]|nr:hypothetical protein [Desulfobacterales bacterium]
MEVEDGLEDEDAAANMILPCVAVPLTDIVLVRSDLLCGAKNINAFLAVFFCCWYWDFCSTRVRHSPAVCWGMAWASLAAS